jgi:hypothetical protein
MSMNKSLRCRLGITECVRHDLLQPHPVLYEKEGEIVAQVHSPLRERLPRKIPRPLVAPEFSPPSGIAAPTLKPES